MTTTFIYDLITVPIDTIYSIIKMLTKTQESILAFLLANPEEKPTIRGIAKKLGKSYTLVYNNIADLKKRDIIMKQDVPPAQIITLNRFAPKEIFIDIELRIRKQFLQTYPWARVMLKDILSAARSCFFILIIFGSYAKGTQSKKSDIDILAIVQEKDDTKEIEYAIRKSYTKARKGINVIDINDFRDMIKDPDELNIGNEARKHHIILHGIDSYYQIV
ncbi:MAG: nucleotidyltransferase domain-containing protein [Candidatus Woesearchaeota archaeon]